MQAGSGHPANCDAFIAKYQKDTIIFNIAEKTRKQGVVALTHFCVHGILFSSIKLLNTAFFATDGNKWSTTEKQKT